ncbi:2'-5' RNA ligase family protein [Hymenobacter sp. BT730]|uniref:2'-5' RNA ligase family protein n=1 Tax=Hymenobacter sp. BT730 TaxID=3063332 RepID=UPI0026DF5B69|nr:2'-5' RNA ligase family protein [Hymenobacter sp. BT730]
MLATTDAPLILTLQLNVEAFAFFNQLRQQHFPPERNYLDAHLTLFHHLPGPDLPRIVEQLSALSATLPPMPLQVTGVRFLGQGVAFALESPAVEALHRRLQQLWQSSLTPQDQQRRRPHVTIQNKVHPEKARRLFEQLQSDFTPFTAMGTGLRLWAYQGGPWALLQAFDFEPEQNG